MTLQYLTGVVLGILGGILTQFGQFLEKRTVNQVRKDSQAKGFFRRLVKSPVWVSGVIFGLGGGTGTDPDRAHFGLLHYFRPDSSKSQCRFLYAHRNHPDHCRRVPSWTEAGCSL